MMRIIPVLWVGLLWLGAAPLQPAEKPTPAEQGEVAWRDMELIDLINNFRLTKQQMLQLANVITRYQTQLAQLDGEELAAYSKVHQALALKRQALVQGQALPPDVLQLLQETDEAVLDVRDQKETLLQKLVEDITKGILSPPQAALISSLVLETGAAEKVLRWQMEQQRQIQEEQNFAWEVLMRVRNMDQVTFTTMGQALINETLSQVMAPTSPYFEAYSNAVLDFFGRVIGLSNQQWAVQEQEAVIQFWRLLREAAGQGNPEGELAQSRTLSEQEFREFLKNPRTPSLLLTRAQYLPEPFVAPNALQQGN